MGDHAVMCLCDGLYLGSTIVQSRLRRMANFDRCRQRSFRTLLLHAAHINGAEEHSWYNSTVPFVVSGNLKECEGELEIYRSDSVSGTYVLLRFCDSCRSSVPAVRQNLSGHGLRQH